MSFNIKNNEIFRKRVGIIFWYFLITQYKPLHLSPLRKPSPGAVAEHQQQQHSSSNNSNNNRDLAARAVYYNVECELSDIGPLSGSGIAWSAAKLPPPPIQPLITKGLSRHAPQLPFLASRKPSRPPFHREIIILFTCSRFFAPPDYDPFDSATLLLARYLRRPPQTSISTPNCCFPRKILVFIPFF